MTSAPRFSANEQNSPTIPNTLFTKLFEVKIDSIANGTNWFTRITILASILVIVLITVLAPKTIETDRFYWPWPPKTFFLASSIYFVIPLLWIGLNYQMR